MGFNYLTLFWILAILISSSNSKVNSQIQGCSLASLDLQHCLNPSSAQTPISIDSCCIALNEAVQAGYHCLCSLFGPTDHPFFSSFIELSIANCYISVPPLTHCQVMEPHPIVTPPIPPVPMLLEPPPSPVEPGLMPPERSRNDLFDPSPPKVNETPLTSTRDNSSITSGEPTLSSSRQPKLSIPERWSHISSHGGNSKTMRLHLIILMIVVAVYAYAG